jgi:hypothetical protein
MNTKHETQRIEQQALAIRGIRKELVNELAQIEGKKMSGLFRVVETSFREQQETVIENAARALAESYGNNWEEMSGFDKQTYINEVTCPRCEYLKDESCACRDPHCHSL